MGFPEELALQSLEHPEDPDTAYSFAFEDYLIKISADQFDVVKFMGSLADKGEVALRITADSIGVFSGQSEFDSTGHYRRYDDPRPGQTWFRQLPGVISPDEVEASYVISLAEETSYVEFASNRATIPGQTLALKGGVIVLDGPVSIPNGPRLSEAIHDGYISPRLSEAALWTPPDVNGEKARFAGINIITLERIYAPEPQPLNRPYET